MELPTLPKPKATIRHDFEDADTGDEMRLEVAVTYTVVQSFCELGDGEIVFTHRLREVGSPGPVEPPL